jgi:signal peptidase
MEPAFYRGDILFLYLAERATRVGEIVVFNIKGREIPIVHRVIRAHGDLKYGGQELLTKGDNNYSDDTVLYAAGQDWLLESQIMGRAVGFPSSRWESYYNHERLSRCQVCRHRRAWTSCGNE